MLLALWHFNVIDGIVNAVDVAILIDTSATDIHLCAQLIFGGHLKVSHLVEPRVDEGAHRTEKSSARLTNQFCHTLFGIHVNAQRQALQETAQHVATQAFIHTSVIGRHEDNISCSCHLS